MGKVHNLELIRTNQSESDARLKSVFDARSLEMNTELTLFREKQKKFFQLQKKEAARRLAELTRRQPNSSDIVNGALAGLQQAQTLEDVRLLENAVKDKLRKSRIDGKQALIPLLVLILAILSACSGAPVGEKVVTASTQQTAEKAARPEEGKKETAAATPTTLFTEDGRSVLMGPSDYAKLIEKSSGKEISQVLSLKKDESLVSRLAKVLADTQALRGGVSAQGIVVIPESPVVTMDNYSFVLAMRPDETVVIAGFNPNEEYAGFLFLTANGQVMSEKPTTTTTDRAAAPTKTPAVKVEPPPLVEATVQAGKTITPTVAVVSTTKEALTKTATAVTGTATVDATKPVTATATAPEATVAVTRTETVITDYKYTKYVDVGFDKTVYAREMDFSIEENAGRMKLVYKISLEAIKKINDAIQTESITAVSMKPDSLKSLVDYFISESVDVPGIASLFKDGKKPVINFCLVSGTEFAGIQGGPISVIEGSPTAKLVMNANGITIYSDVDQTIDGSLKNVAGLSRIEKLGSANEILRDKNIDVVKYWVSKMITGTIVQLEEYLRTNSTKTYVPYKGASLACGGGVACPNLQVKLANKR